ncbi:MAG: extracellular solute-binding protein [Chloroflexi bacterium]|nr:MAG: extracellular solute-binding protein [Chloroflexota bacterium]
MQSITRREFVKRTALAGALLTPIPAILEACSTGTPTTTKTTKLTIAAVQGAEDGPLKKVAPMYQSQSGITMEIVEFPYDQLFEKLVTTFQANGSSYDLCMMDDPWMPKFGTMGALQPLDSNFGFTRDSDIPSIVYDVGTWPPPHGPVPPSEQGKSQHLYGITIVGNVEMFMYRKDLATTAPSSWDDVLANAMKFNKPNFYGYVIRGKATNPASSDSLPILWSFGGDIFDTSWKVMLDSTESIDAITFLTQSLKKYAEPGAANIDAADRDRLIAIGQAFQSTTWPAEVTGVVEAQGVSQVIGKMAYIPIPSDNMKTYVQNGGIPTRTSLLNDPTLGQANPYFPALAQSLAAQPNWRPRTDQWNAVETIYGTAVNQAVAGLKSPKDALTAAAAQVRTAMKQAGYPS